MLTEQQHRRCDLMRANQGWDASADGVLLHPGMEVWSFDLYHSNKLIRCETEPCDWSGPHRVAIVWYVSPIESYLGHVTRNNNTHLVYVDKTGAELALAEALAAREIRSTAQRTERIAAEKRRELAREVHENLESEAWSVALDVDDYDYLEHARPTSSDLIEFIKSRREAMAAEESVE